MRTAFPGFTVNPAGEDTLLRGVIIDQAALYGLINQLQDLAVELLEIRRIPGRFASDENVGGARRRRPGTDANTARRPPGS